MLFRSRQSPDRTSNGNKNPPTRDSGRSVLPPQRTPRSRHSLRPQPKDVCLRIAFTPRNESRSRTEALSRKAARFNSHGRQPVGKPRSTLRALQGRHQRMDEDDVRAIARTQIMPPLRGSVLFLMPHSMGSRPWLLNPGSSSLSTATPGPGPATHWKTTSPRPPSFHSTTSPVSARGIDQVRDRG